MQRMLCLLLAAAALCGCADGERYRLSGSVEGAEGVLLLTNLCTVRHAALPRAGLD